MSVFNSSVDANTLVYIYIHSQFEWGTIYTHKRYGEWDTITKCE